MPKKPRKTSKPNESETPGADNKKPDPIEYSLHPDLELEKDRIPEYLDKSFVASLSQKRMWDTLNILFPSAARQTSPFGELKPGASYLLDPDLLRDVSLEDISEIPQVLSISAPRPVSFDPITTDDISLGKAEDYGIVRRLAELLEKETKRADELQKKIASYSEATFLVERMDLMQDQLKKIDVIKQQNEELKKDHEEQQEILAGTQSRVDDLRRELATKDDLLALKEAALSGAEDYFNKITHLAKAGVLHARARLLSLWFSVFFVAMLLCSASGVRIIDLGWNAVFLAFAIAFYVVSWVIKSEYKSGSKNSDASGNAGYSGDSSNRQVP